MKDRPSGTYCPAMDFENPVGVPGSVGIIPSGTLITGSVWMKKSADLGVIRPYWKLYLDNALSTVFCTAGGPAIGTPALDRTLRKYTISCTTSSSVAMTTDSRFYLTVGAYIDTGPGSHNLQAQLNVEGATDGNYDSTIDIPNPTPVTITGISPSSGSANTSVTITGTNFGSSQGSSTVAFNGVTTSPTNWSTNGTSITAPVPSGASTGPITVTVAGSLNTCPSNNCTFTVIPTITSLSDTFGPRGWSITITGTGFGSSQGLSTVTVNGVAATPTNWNANGTSITAPVPVTAPLGAGGIVVTVGGFANTCPNNNCAFTVVGPPSLTSLTPSTGHYTDAITIAGNNFMAPQGSSTITFNGMPATPTSWSNQSITAPVPGGATSGNVVVTVANQAGNALPFTVIPPPTLLSAYPGSAQVGAAVTIWGTNFGPSQGTNTIAFNGTTAAVTNWADTRIDTSVPANATSGNVVVSVSNQPSNGVPFSVLTAGTLSGTVTRATGGSAVSGATVQAVLTGVVKGSWTTAANGTYSIASLDPGTYDVRVSASGFVTEVQQGVSITANGTATANVSLWQPGSISGTVIATSTSNPLLGAAVAMYLGPTSKGTSTTNASGVYAVGNLHPGAYTLQVAYAGYRTKEQAVTISENANTSANVSLDGAPAGPVQYAYDDLSRLIQVIDPSGDSAIYHYDKVGNITGIDRAGASSVAVAGFSPASGPVGQTVTIYGTGFSPTANLNTVSFSGTGATVTSATANQIVTTVPTGATSGTVAVTAPNGSGSSATSFTVLGASAGPPTISGFSPSIWPGTGSLTINGTNFDTTPANDRVTINVGLATPSAASATSLTVPVVNAATSGKLTVATVAGTATSTSDFFVPPAGYSAANIHSTGRMTVGGTEPFSFATAGQFSLRLFDSLQGHRVSASFNTATLTTGTAAIYDPWGHIPVGGSAGLSTNFLSFIDPIPIASAGSYTVLVAPAGSSTGSTTVTLYDVPDDVTAAIVPGGASVPVSTSTPGQNARLTFSGTSGQRVSVKAVTDSTLALGGLSLVNPDGTTLGGVNAISTLFANSITFRDLATLPSSGTYTVLVDPSKAATGGTTITLYDVPADDPGSVTVNGSSSTVTIGTPGQNGVRTFTGNPSQQVTVHVTNNNNGIGSVTVNLLSTDGTTVLASAATGAVNFDLPTVTLPANAPPNGTYTITIDPFNWATGTLNVGVSSP